MPSSLFKQEDIERGQAMFKNGVEVTTWLRPNSIPPSSHERRLNWTLFNNPKSTDIVQGVLGNCWYVII